MERIYNKLKRLRVEELVAECDDSGIDTSRCKTKDDYIRAFIKKKCTSAKLTPSKGNKISSAKSDRSSVSKSSTRSKCIIEDINDPDTKKLNTMVDKRIKKR